MTDSQPVGQTERSVSVEVRWVPTDPHGALPGHHWQGTVMIDGKIEYQRRYFKKWLALADAQGWLTHRVEVEQEIESMKERVR